MVLSAARRSVLCLVLALLTSCSPRPGVVGAGRVPPPSGARLVERVMGQMTTIRKATPALAPVRREPALDERAATGLRIVEAGIPDEVDIIKHLEQVAALPEGLEYGVIFEDDTPGLAERTRRAGERRGGSPISDALLAGEPGFDAVGWAASGPWAVLVLQHRPFGPADGPPLQAALEGALQQERPTLRPDPALAAHAAGALADGLLDHEDEVGFARAGGVPVRIAHVWRGAHRATATLNWALSHDGPGTLHEPWLTRVGVAARVTERGNVLYVVLATGEADRPALDAQLRAAEAKAPALVNDARAAAALPAVRLDPALAEAARRSIVEAIRLGCFPADPGCPAADPRGADRWYDRRVVWFSAEHAFTWDLRPSDSDDRDLKRFGAAAVLGPDGAVWSMLVLAV